MKTVTQTVIVYPNECGELSELIEKLTAIRANTNEKITIIMGGSQDFGYRIQLVWERPMTEEELRRDEDAHVRARVALKEMRRQEYLKLKAEFENEETNII